MDDESRRRLPKWMTSADTKASVAAVNTEPKTKNTKTTERGRRTSVTKAKRNGEDDPTDVITRKRRKTEDDELTVEDLVAIAGEIVHLNSDSESKSAAGADDFQAPASSATEQSLVSNGSSSSTADAASDMLRLLLGPLLEATPPYQNSR